MLTPVFGPSLRCARAFTETAALRMRPRGCRRIGHFHSNPCRQYNRTIPVIAVSLKPFATFATRGELR